MSNTFDKKIVNGEVALKLLQGLKTKMDGEDVQAKRVKGVLDISNIPQSAIPTLKVVQDDEERFRLTSDDVKKGDTVKVLKTKKLYLVTDVSRLSSQEGYTEYAQTVDWNNIEGKPGSFPPSVHSQTSDSISHMKLYVKGQDTSEITPDDSLNTAIGKLEAKLDTKLNRVESGLNGEQKDLIKSINKNSGQFIKSGVENISEITQDGWYLCNTNCTDAPTMYEGIVVNYNSGDNSSVKIWYSTTQDSVYVKQDFPGVIKKDWVKLISQSDINSVKDVIEQSINSKQNKTDQLLNTDSKDIVGAINELQTNKQASNDGRLTTSDKTVVGAINELKEGKAEKVHNHDDIYMRTETVTQKLSEKENVIVKKSAFNKDFGLTSGTVADGKVVADLKEEVANISEKVAPMIEGKLDKTGGKITGNLEIDGNFVTKNNVGVQCKDNKGTAKNIIYVDNSDVVKVGDGTLNIVLDSDNITLKGGKTLWNNQNFNPQTKQDVTNPSLQTGDKTVVGSINEVLTKVKKNSSDIANKAPLVHNHDDSYMPRQDLEETINTLTVEIQSKEPTIVEKGTAFNKNFGTSAGTVLEGNNLATINSKIEEKQNKTDILLQTSSKDIVGAINEIKLNTLGSTGGKVNGAINSVENNGAGNYNIVESDGRTVHGTIYGRKTSSSGVGELGLYNKKGNAGIRVKDSGAVDIEGKTFTAQATNLQTTAKEVVSAINELKTKKLDLSGGTLVGHADMLRLNTSKASDSAYIKFLNNGVEKGWMGKGSSSTDSIAIHNSTSNKGMTFRPDGATLIDATNLKTKSKEVVGAVNELLSTKLNLDGSNKMTGSLSFGYGNPTVPNIKFLDASGSMHGSLNARGGDVDEDIYLENNTGGNGLFLKDNGEVHISSKRMRITAPNLETNSKEVIGAINELRKVKGKPIPLDTDVDLDTVNTTGFYLLNASEHTATNIPTKAKGQGFFLIAMRTGGSFVVQELTLYKTGERFLRAGNISSLPTWKELANETYLDKKFDKTGGTINGSITVNEFIKTNVSNASAIQAVRGDYTAMMGCSSTAGDFVFGGKPNSKGDYESYIRIANNKCRYHNTSGEWDILHKGIFNPDTKLNTSGGTMTGELHVKAETSRCKIRLTDTTESGTDSVIFRSNGGLAFKAGSSFSYLYDSGNLSLHAKNVTTNAKEVVGAINELNANKLNLSGGTMTGNLTVGTNTNKGKLRVVSGGDSIALAVPNDESNYITFVKNNASSSVRKAWFGFGDANSDKISLTLSSTNKSLTLQSDGNLTYGGSTVFHTGNCNISKSASGYQKLPSGLIIQWGVTAKYSANFITTTFPVAFTAVPQVSCTVRYDGDGTVSSHIMSTTISAVTTKNFKHMASYVTGTGAVSKLQSGYCTWIAIGY